jgi:hypothetical protein
MMGRKHPGPGAAVLFVQSRSDRLDDHQVVPLLVFWTFPGSAPSWHGTILITGRPSIDPALMIRMLIVGYVFAIVLSVSLSGHEWRGDGSKNE